MGADVRDENAEFCGAVRPLRIQLVIRPLRRMFSDTLIRCCAAGTNRCLDLRHRAFSLDGQVSAEWSRFPASVARHARDCVAPKRRSSADWMTARVGRLSAGLGSGLPRVSRARGQTQFWRPHPARPWQHRCED